MKTFLGRDKYDWIAIVVVSILATIAISLFNCKPVHADDHIVDFNKMVEAIGKAENSVKYPYGIKSINTHGDKTYARQICLNTVRNNWKRYIAVDQTPTKNEYLNFLGSRFCPVGAKDDPKGLNKNWVKNVSYFYGV